MKKTIKCGIVAAVAFAAGFAAYQSYGSYGTKDSNLLMQNVEALAQDVLPEGPTSGDPIGDNGNRKGKHEKCIVPFDAKACWSKKDPTDFRGMTWTQLIEVAYKEKCRCTDEESRACPEGTYTKD